MKEKADIILNLTQSELCTIITALKNERYRATDAQNKDAENLIDAALSAINHQPWCLNSRTY